MTDWSGRDTVDLGTQLFDRQILGPDDVDVGKVDDVELRRRSDGRLEVAALLVGSRALSSRLPAWGRFLLRAVAWAGGGPSPVRRIDVDDVADVNARLTVTRKGAEAADDRATDRIRRLVEKIPGSGHASR